MAVTCGLCGGIIPDVVFTDVSGRVDCKYHIKGEIDIKHFKGVW